MTVQSNNLFWPELHWPYFFIFDPEGGVTWDTPDGLFVDKRSDMYHPGTYYPKKMPQQPATAYLCALADNHGQPLDAQKTYRLHVPKDFATWAFIYNPLDRVGLSTYDAPNMKTNADGSVDIYFGPKAPAGLESNWIPTQGKRAMPVMRFYGGTEAFWNRSSKLPDPEIVQ